MMSILDQLTADALPKVIFLDAMGTLFELKNTVGEIYQQYADKYGVKADPQAIEQAFIHSFKSAAPLAFSRQELFEIKQQEFDWWKQVVSVTFTQLGLLANFDDFNAFFSEIYHYFGTGEPWCIFPDTIDSLTRWSDRGIELGIISNFDSRLLEVLNFLDLDQFFTSITISSTAGFAKPDANIFHLALRKHHLAPHQAWHIGDSVTEDYTGAKNAGFRSFCLNRQGHSLNIENQLPNLWTLG
jgi:putative hydrolase of the HAD superfamily